MALSQVRVKPHEGDESIARMDSVQQAAIDLLGKADLITPMALRVAATLKLVDHLEAGVTDLPGLARVTRCHERPLGKVLDHLVSLGVVERAGERYRVSALGAPLSSRCDHLGVRPMLDVEHLIGKAELAMVDLLHTVRTGAAAYEERGVTLWEDLNAAGGGAPGMDAFRRTAALFDAEAIAEQFDWSQVRDVVDVGGNSGAVAISLLQAHPHLTATVFDLPCFGPAAREAIERAQLADRCEVTSGSFFDGLPPGRDVYLLSAILADWSDEDAVRILRQCRRAAGPTGVVLLAEVHLRADHPDPVHRTAAALRIEASMGHPDRTPADLAELAARAGLRVTWEGRHTPVRSLLALRAETEHR